MDELLNMYIDIKMMYEICDNGRNLENKTIDVNHKTN